MLRAFSLCTLFGSSLSAAFAPVIHRGCGAAGWAAATVVSLSFCLVTYQLDRLAVWYTTRRDGDGHWIPVSEWTMYYAVMAWFAIQGFAIGFLQAALLERVCE